MASFNSHCRSESQLAIPIQKNAKLCQPRKQLEQVTLIGQPEFDQGAFGQDPRRYPVSSFVAFTSFPGNELRKPPADGLGGHTKGPRHIRRWHGAAIIIRDKTICRPVGPREIGRAHV